MPDQSSAADEHAILAEITAPLASLPDDLLPAVTDVDFPRVLRGYDPLAVDAYVRKTAQLVAELQSTRSPEAAVRRALERVGEQISGILQRAHETAEQITVQSRREAEDRLEQARQEAAQIAASGEQRIKDLDTDADRIWAERLRIIDDARELAAQLLALADAASERFPPADDTGSLPPVDDTGSIPPLDDTGSVPPVDDTGSFSPGDETGSIPPEDTAASNRAVGDEPGAAGAADAMRDGPDAAGSGDAMIDAPVAAPADAPFGAPAADPVAPAHETVLFDAEADEGVQDSGPAEYPGDTEVLPDDTEATRVMPAVPRADEPAPHEPPPEEPPPRERPPEEPHAGPNPDEPPAGLQ